MAPDKSPSDNPTPPIGTAPVTRERLREAVIPSDLARVTQQLKLVMDEVEAVGHPAPFVFAARLAMDEAMANAVKHGNKGDLSKSVTVRWHVDPELFYAEVTDEGPGFKPEDVPDCTAEENLTRPSGRGVMLMKAYMTDVAYNETGNTVCLTKRAEPPESGDEA